MIDAPQQDERKTKNNHARGPDVGREVERVGFQSLAVVLGCDAAQGARTPPVNGHGDQHYGEGPHGGFDLDAAEK